MHGSYLFAHANNPKLLNKVFEAGADAVILDLEDAVPPQDKATHGPARRRRCGSISPGSGSTRPTRSCTRPTSAPWLRVPPESGFPRPSQPTTCVGRPTAPRIPRSSTPSKARAECSPRTISPVPGVRHLAIGGVDRRRDLNCGPGDLPTLHARSHLVLVSRAAGIAPPTDNVYPRLNDKAGPRHQTQLARSLGFFGKSAIHPRQLPVLHEVFTPSEEELRWARDVVAVFAEPRGAAGGCPTDSSSICPSPSGPTGSSNLPQASPRNDGRPPERHVRGRSAEHKLHYQ